MNRFAFVFSVGIASASQNELSKEILRAKVPKQALFEMFSNSSSELSLSEYEKLTFDDHHLRSLRMKDNFISYNVYADSSCESLNLQYNTILNMCIDEVILDTDEKRSRILKLNKKDFLLVEIYYDGHGCGGIPSKVSELSKDLSFEDYGVCFYSTSLGSYAKVDYVTTWPTMPANTGSTRKMWYEESSEKYNCMDHANFIGGYFAEWPVYIFQCRSDEAGTSFYLECNTDGSVDQVFFPNSESCSGTSMIGMTDVFGGCHLDDPDEKDEWTTFRKTENIFCVPPMNP